jgi:hypothetical protein
VDGGVDDFMHRALRSGVTLVLLANENHIKEVKERWRMARCLFIVSSHLMNFI